MLRSTNAVAVASLSQPHQLRATTSCTLFRRTSRPSHARQDSRIIAYSGEAQRDVMEVTSRRDLLMLGAAASVVSPFILPPGVIAAPASDLGESIKPFHLEDFTPEDGWVELNSGILYKVDRIGEGDSKKGIFDKVDHYQPFPFVSLYYTAYTPNGKVWASSVPKGVRGVSYQAGVRQELQDEDGAVMSMKVGEKRRFVVPLEVAFKRKAFGEMVPANQEALLFDVELLVIQPY